MFFKMKKINLERFLASSENKGHVKACARTVQLLRHEMYCPITLSY